VQTYLDGIVGWHRERALSDPRELDDCVEAALRSRTPLSLADSLNQCIADGDVAVIAEVKRRSPSLGPIVADLDPRALSSHYQAGGAAAISVLTDGPHFGGSAADLSAVRDSVAIPVLRKDFTVDPRDVCDARVMGADAVLLIAAVLDDVELERCVEASRALSMGVLFEVHDDAELERVLAFDPDIVGINRRDLHTFVVDLDRSLALVAQVPPGVIAVAESGISGVDDVHDAVAAGFHAVLVGELLVRSTDPARTVASLREANGRTLW